MHVASSGDEEEDEEDRESFGGFSDGEEEENSDDDEAVARQLELEAETSGRSVGRDQENPQAKAKTDARKALQRKAKGGGRGARTEEGNAQQEEERKQFEQMEFSNNKKSTEDLKLRAKEKKRSRRNLLRERRLRGMKIEERVFL